MSLLLYYFLTINDVDGMAVICTVCLTSLQVVNVLVGRTFCVYIPNTRSFLEELPVVELKLCRGCIHGEE